MPASRISILLPVLSAALLASGHSLARRESPTDEAAKAAAGALVEVNASCRAAYRAARRKAYGQAIARLQQGSTAAATTLLKVMVDPNTPASTRVRSAESVLTHAAKAIEIEDIEARVAALERAAETSKGGGRQYAQGRRS